MKRTGLDRSRWVDPIDDFVRRYGHSTPRWAVFLTYEIDLDRFDRLVLPVLARRGKRFRSVLISDQATLEKSLTLSRPQLRGAVNLHPVRCNGGGVFHPKLVFLRAGRHVRACFGSANITASGMGSNLELWTFTESPEILGGIQHFLRALMQSPDLIIDDGARRSLRRAMAGLVENETTSVWSSLQESFASRVRRGPERNAPCVTVLSPMYATEGGIKAARAAIPSSEVRLFTDAAVAVPNSLVFVYSPPHIADQDEDADSFPRDLHAKAYVFRPRVGGNALAWIGSANFTARALTKTVSKGGNVELMVRTILPKDEVEALDADLEELFENGQALTKDFRPDTSSAPKAHGTILACDLVGSASAPYLLIHTTQRQGYVVLKSHGGRVRVAIKNRQAILKGDSLHRLLPELDLAAAHAFMICQVLNSKEIPVVVNVPHVPVEDAANGHSQASIDSLLDDLLGRVPISRAQHESDDEKDELDTSDGDGDGEVDAESSAYERRLDQVLHQGEIDQLAVKAALLRQLAVRATAPGAERASMFADIVRVLLRTSHRHLVPVIRTLFDNIDPSEST